MQTTMIKFWSKSPEDHSFLLPPSAHRVIHSKPRWSNFYNSLPFLLCTSRHISNSLSVYFFLDSEPKLGKSKEFNNQDMEVQVKRAFKCYFWPIKKQTGSTWNFVQPPMQVCRCASIPNFKINASFLCFPFFFKYINPQIRINKMVKEHIADYHPSPSVFSINLKDTSSHIFMDSLELFLSLEHLLTFLSNLYI